jgi:hypothetical protein
VPFSVNSAANTGKALAQGWFGGRYAAPLNQMGTSGGGASIFAGSPSAAFNGNPTCSALINPLLATSSSDFFDYFISQNPSSASCG